MNLLIKSILIGFFVLTANAFSLFRIEGGLPPGVDTVQLAKDYYRVYTLLAPGGRIERTPITLIFYTKESDLARDQVLPEWGGGGAIDANTVILPIDKPFVLGWETQRTILHEIIHCIIKRAYPGVTVPRWYHEGCAMFLSGEIGFQEQSALSLAVFFGGMVPLDSIEHVNDVGQNRARLAYSQSHAMILYLVNKYGLAVLSQILSKSSRSNNFWTGIESAIGLNQEEFSNAVLGWIKTRYGVVFIFGDGFFIWIIIVFLFILGYIVTKFRNYKKKQQMLLEEQAALAMPVMMVYPQAQDPASMAPPPSIISPSVSDNHTMNQNDESLDDEVDEEEDDEEFDDYYDINREIEGEDEDDPADPQSPHGPHQSK